MNHSKILSKPPPTYNTSTMPSPSISATVTTVNHIFVFPYPAQGHMLPLLDLTHQLALQGLKITILVTPKNLPTLSSLLTTHPNSIQTLVLPLPTHPKLPLGVENVSELGNAGNGPIILALKNLEGDVISWFKTHPSPPQVMISDFFLGYTNEWAQQLNIPRIGFFSSGAFFSSIMYFLLQDVETLWPLEHINFLNIPRSPTFAHQHLPGLFRGYKKGDYDWMVCKETLHENFRSYGLVFNTIDELEREYLDHIKKEVGHDRVYSVGPLNSIGLTRDSISSGVGHDVLNWLDKCEDESVLFVCFGSQKMLTEQQMEALANGLEKCGSRFIWVIKSEASHMVPDGFEKRVEEQGLVVRGWVPQREILNHKAVGGFVSHCGWNSLLESIMAGVMILAWPMEADQFQSARLLVEYKGCAVQLCEGEHTIPDPDVLSRIITESLTKDIPQKARAKVIRDKALEAVKFGGSSMKDLDAFVTLLARNYDSKSVSN